MILPKVCSSPKPIGIMCVFWRFLKKAGWLHLLAHIICMCLFSAQTYKLVENIIVPTLSHTYMKEVPLKDVDFPFDIKICVKPSMNKTALKMFGYENIEDYIVGLISKSNYSLVGWGEHSKNNKGSFASAREIFNAIKLNLTKEVINEVQIIENDDDMLERKNIVQADLKKINRIHACHLLNTKPFANMKSFGLVFNEVHYNPSVELKLEDQGLRLQRDPPPMNHFYSSGERMKLVSKGMFRYIVKIRERVFIEGDPGQTCRNYPNTEFASYSECDDQYVRKRVEEIAPGLNLTPIWMSDHLDTVTSELLPTNLSMLGKDYFPLQKYTPPPSFQCIWISCSLALILQTALSRVAPSQQRSSYCKWWNLPNQI